MKSLTFIVPIHEYNEKIEQFAINAFGSLKELKGASKNKVTIVGPEDVISKVKVIFDDLKCPQSLTLLPNDNTDMFVQINKAVYACTTKYFSVLEIDDKYKPIWISNVDKYIDNSINYALYIPLNETVNEKGEILGLLNEIAWSSSFIEGNNIDDLGFITINELDNFMDFNITGSIINTEAFISAGGLKPSLKIAAWYEFLLRICYLGNKIYVLPIVGYTHTFRENSYITNIKKQISVDEGKWLITTAKQEYFFKEDRNKQYKKDGGEG